MYTYGYCSQQPGTLHETLIVSASAAIVMATPSRVPMYRYADVYLYLVIW